MKKWASIGNVKPAMIRTVYSDQSMEGKGSVACIIRLKRSRLKMRNIKVDDYTYSRLQTYLRRDKRETFDDLISRLIDFWMFSMTREEAVLASDKRMKQQRKCKTCDDVDCIARELKGTGCLYV